VAVRKKTWSLIPGWYGDEPWSVENMEERERFEVWSLGVERAAPWWVLRRRTGRGDTDDGKQGVGRPREAIVSIPG